MPKYEVTMSVEFEGTIEADSESEAEQLAYTSWGDTYESPITYSQVLDITLEETEMCEDCDEELRVCACEEEMANA